MNKYDYFIYKKYLSLKDVKNISKALIKYSNPKNKDNPAKAAIKTADVKITAYGHVKEPLKPLMDIVHDTNNKYFGYNLNKTLDCQTVHFNEYLPNDKVGYDWHIDFSPYYAQDIKLTVLVNLSESKYKGGELSIFNCGKIDFCEPGDILIFKSFMLHKVDKIISGKRRTLSLWMEGPCFK